MLRVLRWVGGCFATPMFPAQANEMHSPIPSMPFSTNARLHHCQRRSEARRVPQARRLSGDERSQPRLLTCSGVRLPDPSGFYPRVLLTTWADWTLNSTYSDAGVNVVSNAVASACGTAGVPGMVAGFSAYNMDGCPTGSGTANYDLVNPAQVKCQLDADGGYACNRTDGSSIKTADLTVVPTAVTLSNLANNHFFAPWVFGGTRIFTADGGASPLAYDTARFTGTDLIDVTATTCTGSACTGNVALNTDKGWQLQYLDDPVSPTVASLTHRTGSGAVLLSGCVLWNGLFPNGSTPGACEAPNPSSAQLFQANYLTGAPNCASSFLVAGSYARYIQRAVNSPPPEPAMVAQISAAGQVQYSLVSMEMNNGQPTQANVSLPQDLLQSIYELPVNKAVHMCRHRNSSGLCAPQPP